MSIRSARAVRSGLGSIALYDDQGHVSLTMTSSRQQHPDSEIAVTMKR